MRLGCQAGGTADLIRLAGCFSIRGVVQRRYFRGKLFVEVHGQAALDERRFDRADRLEERIGAVEQRLVSVRTGHAKQLAHTLSLIHISEPTRLLSISYAVF